MKRAWTPDKKSPGQSSKNHRVSKTKDGDKMANVSQDHSMSKPPLNDSMRQQRDSNKGDKKAKGSADPPLKKKPTLFQRFSPKKSTDGQNTSIDKKPKKGSTDKHAKASANDTFNSFHSNMSGTRGASPANTSMDQSAVKRRNRGTWL